MPGLELPVSIPRGGRFEGLLAFRGGGRIEGELLGEVRGSGLLDLGAAARVVGRVEADEVVVQGVLEGDVYAKTRIVLLPSAVVLGELCSPLIRIEDGAKLSGRCTSGGAPHSSAAQDEDAAASGEVPSTPALPTSKAPKARPQAAVFAGFGCRLRARACE